MKTFTMVVTLSMIQSLRKSNFSFLHIIGVDSKSEEKE